MSFQTPLPGIPNIESPFFDRIFTPDSFDNDIIAIARQMREKGYAIVEFPDPDLADKAATIREALNEPDEWEDGPEGRQWKPSLAGRRFQDAWETVPAVRDLAVNARVVNLLTALYGRRAWPFQALNFPVGTQQHYHADAVHFSSYPERFMCGVWVALEDIGPDQGPLEYFPGSHRWPIYTREQVGRFDISPSTTQEVFHRAWEELIASTGTSRETFHARKGQALIWAANLLHGGSAHLDRRLTRWSQVTHYYFDDCAYYTPMHSDFIQGRLAFRRPIDISTGEVVENRPNGASISPAFMAFATRS